MSVREYIGARYVPLFMGAWDNTATYEPLSIVQYQGNSYTSRQYVPTGIEITNTAYWAETGNYNAQVEQYRQEVLTFNTRIENNTNAIAANADAIAANVDAIAANADAIAANTELINALNNEYVMHYSSLEEAISDINLKTCFIITASYHQNTDIGGAIYEVSENEPNTYFEKADNGLYLKLLNANNVSQFGAIGNGIADDTVALQKAIDNLDVVNFENSSIYRTSNLLIKDSGKTLNGNNATLRSDGYFETTLTNALAIGTNKIQVADASNLHINQTAVIYNENNNPNSYQIVITGINGNEITFASYKPFKHDDVMGDSSPYQFPIGSTLYTGTTIISIMKGLNVESYGIISNVEINNFIFEQPTSIAINNVEWGRIAYGILCYNTENVTFVNNHVTHINELFLMFYGYNRNILVEKNTFENATVAYAVCAHWDMQNVSLNNRAHDFRVIDNTFRNCHYNIIYSSVDGGICNGNTIYNDTLLQQGIYIYGGDIAIHTAYRNEYVQSDWYSKDIIVSDNMITAEGRKAGIGIEFLGAYNCQASNNFIKETVAGILLGACTNIDVANNMIEYPYLGTSVENCSVRVWGMVVNAHIHDNMFNTPRVMRIEQHYRTISTGNISATETYGYADSTIFIENNKIMQSDGTTLVWVDGHLETNNAPSTLVDVPKMIMFNKNTVINSAKTNVTVFQINSTLANIVTSVENLTAQMYVINNISYGLTPIMQKFLSVVPNLSNIEMD